MEDAPPPASQATRFRITVTDNGPGIVRQQIPRSSRSFSTDRSFIACG